MVPKSTWNAVHYPHSNPTIRCTVYDFQLQFAYFSYQAYSCDMPSVVVSRR